MKNTVYKYTILKLVVDVLSAEKRRNVDTIPYCHPGPRSERCYCTLGASEAIRLTFRSSVGEWNMSDQSKTLTGRPTEQSGKKLNYTYIESHTKHS